MSRTYHNLSARNGQIVYAIASDMFASFLDPVVRGNKFNWNTCPDSIKSFVTYTIGVHSPKISDIDRTLAGEMAFDLVTKWVKLAGLNVRNEN